VCLQTGADNLCIFEGITVQILEQEGAAARPNFDPKFNRHHVKKCKQLGPRTASQPRPTLHSRKAVNEPLHLRTGCNVSRAPEARAATNAVSKPRLKPVRTGVSLCNRFGASDSVLQQEFRLVFHADAAIIESFRALINLQGCT
jgi:hypothetical protein